MLPSKFILRVKRLAVALAAAMICGEATATGCPPVFDNIYIDSFVSGISSMIDSISSLVSGVGWQAMYNSQREMSGLKVLTKQISGSSEKEIIAMNQSMQGLATTVISQQTSEDVQKVYADYGTATGQGYDPCGEQTKALAVTGGYANTQNVTSAVRGSIDAAPGVWKDRTAAMTTRVNDHRQSYCTADEVKAGMCQTVGSNPGQDLTFSTFMVTATQGSVEDRAKDAFVNHVFGLPDQPFDPKNAKTPEVQAQMRDKMMRDGYRTIAATSFKSIQAMSTANPNATNPTNNNGYVATTSFLDALDQKIDQYAGGANYLQWEKTLAIQSDRGLLVDLAKMAAFKLYLTSVEYDQYERMEANLAGLLSLENRARGR
jgi:hypothetical protein